MGAFRFGVPSGNVVREQSRTTGGSRIFEVAPGFSNAGNVLDIIGVHPFTPGNILPFFPPLQPEQPAQPSQPTVQNPVANVLAAINGIPLAVEGQPVTTEHHNSIRTALIAIANQLGLGPVSPTETVTFTPAFQPIPNATNWEFNNFTARKPAAAAAVDGWLPLQLPDGARIQSVTVTGRRSGTVANFRVRLLRQPASGSAANQNPAELLSIALTTAGEPFNVTESIRAETGSGAGANVVLALTAEEFKLIDNSAYKYMVRASFDGGAAEAQVEIHAIQVTCAR